MASTTKGPRGGYLPDLMGTPDRDPFLNNNEFQHEVTLSPFLIAKHEVTQAQWEHACRAGTAGPFAGGPRGAYEPSASIRRSDRRSSCSSCRSTLRS